MNYLKRLLKTSLLSLLIISVYYNSFCFEGSQAQEKLKISQLKLVIQKQTPTQALLDLLKLSNIKHNGTVEDIIIKIKDIWLRKPGSERWQIDGPEKIECAKALPCLEKLGMLQTVSPSFKEYDYALIFGGITTRVRVRLKYLIDLWEQGVRFKTLVLLGSERPLDTIADSVASISDKSGLSAGENFVIPKTECEMMKVILAQTKLPIDMKNILVVVVNSPQVKMPNGAARRATTADTISDWLKTSPAAPGKCLFVSNQPYVGYQNSVVQLLLPEKFTSDTVGVKVDNLESVNVNVCLDTLVRWLYQEFYKRPICLY